jgi:large conductance mechanosensitive channel
MALYGGLQAAQEESRMMKEFKSFLLHGNVVDLAVGVVIGAAFGAVVSSFVQNILMPPIGKLTGGVDFISLYIPLGGLDATTHRPLGIYYGSFINALVVFVIIAALIFFLVVKPMSKLAPTPKRDDVPVSRECSECLTSIPVNARRCSACGQPQAAG